MYVSLVRVGVDAERSILCSGELLSVVVHFRTEGEWQFGQILSGHMRLNFQTAILVKYLVHSAY